MFLWFSESNLSLVQNCLILKINKMKKYVENYLNNKFDNLVN